MRAAKDTCIGMDGFEFGWDGILIPKGLTSEAVTAEQHSRESIRIARTTRELLKKFAAAYRMFSDMDDHAQSRSTRIDFKPMESSFTDEDIHEHIAITKELFLLIIQDQSRPSSCEDELELPHDRANLFEIIDADGSGTLHVTELVQGLLKIRGEVKKSDAVATLLATKAIQNMVLETRPEFTRGRTSNLDVLPSTSAMAHREAFATVLDENWKIFRDQVLEALPDTSVLPDTSEEQILAQEHRVGVQGPCFTPSFTRLPQPRGHQRGGLPQGIRAGAVQLRRWWSDFEHEPQQLQASDSFLDGPKGGRKKIPYLVSSLDQLSTNEARAIRHRLRVRLGAMSRVKMVSGESLLEAVSALGLTRYSLEEMNDIVNFLADFIGLKFQANDSGGTRVRKRKTIFNWEEGHGEEYGTWTWQWPAAEELAMRRTASTAALSAFSEAQAQSHFNLVPANALLGAQQNETDHRSHPLKPQHGCHGATVPCVPGHTLVRRRVDLHWVVAVTSVQRLCTVA
eukprot:g3518.t1